MIFFLPIYEQQNLDRINKFKTVIFFQTLIINRHFDPDSMIRKIRMIL